MTVETGDGPRQVLAPDLLRIEWADGQPLDQPRLELTDGTQVGCTSFSLIDEIATVGVALTGGSQSLTRSAVSRVDFPPRIEGVDSLWRELGQSETAGDVLIVKKRAAEGQPPRLDYLTGVIKNVDAEKVEFLWDGDAIPVKQSKVASLGFYRPQAAQAPDAICKITTTDGSTLPVESVEFDGRTTTISTPAGLSVEIPVAQLAEADYSQGKLVYLSDLEPLATNWTPYIGLPSSVEYIQGYGLPRRDRSYDGAPLSLNVADEGGGERLQSFRKGLALRSRTEIVYRIPQGMQRLAALAGIDPETRRQGHVTLEVFVDDALVWQGAIDGSEPPQPVEASLSEARRLRIVVDYGENLDYGDRLHLVDARVMK